MDGDIFPFAQKLAEYPFLRLPDNMAVVDIRMPQDFPLL